MNTLAQNSFCFSNKDEKANYKRADICHCLTEDSDILELSIDHMLYIE